MLQDQTSSDQLCPCQSGKPFNFCCGPAINGSRPAKTAEALMRSRYSAFFVGTVDYLIESTAPETRREEDRELLIEQSQITNWTQLTILEAQVGQSGDTEGQVSFEAHFESPDGNGILRETSRFRRDGERWYYVDGDLELILT
ncbi:zinc chelation protein SecC [Nitrincola sp. A-D6]|uniref:YchJ family protein n=1 Tax=Nitrincola sp. A-D6 TaxID=1545442 RepID=UPI00051FE473|nr:YchJ family protein [Nitrincola sp. A-D6]KGK42539.1 zinc chelation protein SecC [Nitrincola sp. A-D6]